ncbi:MAG: 16S rRNA (uracil(1498)-N(3))-methyltransferase [Acetobacteraceae bacterium]|nr:16S rRNA (uracil(1498)-N(3))-methyltransferase [Acetobacteraceae bacterium]
MPGSIRLFVDAPLTKGAEILASPGQAHHLGTVMRRAVGAPVRLFNGRDGEWLARTTALTREGARLAVQHQLRPQSPEPDIWLAFALLKRDATDLLTQKATELGVAALRPVTTERTIAARVNTARLKAIAIEAAEQSERLTVPEIHGPCPLAGLLASWPVGRTLYAAVERGPAPPLAPARAPAGLLVGPEGGFTDRELDALAQHTSVSLASLGPRILRAETAAIAGLALLQAPGGR